MNIYLSAGPSTIAALMAVDRVGGEGAGGERVERRGSAGPVVGRTGHPILRRCERAVVTAYCDLVLHGTAESAALQACSQVYLSHHPEASPFEAAVLVEGWVGLHCRDDAAD